MLPVNVGIQFEILAGRLLCSRAAFSSRKFSPQSKSHNPLTESKMSRRVSERCQLLIASHRGSWHWTVDPTKVLVVLMTWLGAKDKHVYHYSQLYTKLGLDVLVVKSEMKDFVWPAFSMALAEQVYSVLENQMQGYDHFICHTMSAGSYNWTILRMLLKQKGNPENICSKFRGQVLDSVTAGAGKGGVFEESAVDGQPQVHALDRMVHGITVAQKSGPIMQWAVKSLAKTFFAMTKKQTVGVFEESVMFFKEEPLKVPTLFFASRDDPMCDAAVLEKLVELWKSKHDFPVSIKIWDSSPHTQHYLYHTEEYERLHEELLNLIFTPVHVDKVSYQNSKSKL